MNARILFDQALEQGVVLYLAEGKLKYQAGGDGLPDALRSQLKEHREALIDYLKQLEDEEKARGWKLPPLTPYQGLKQYPLSFAQQRLWFIDRLEGGSPQYNMPGAFKLEGTLDREAFHRALAQILERHQVLRTRFDDDNDPVTQYVVNDYPLPLKEIDLSDWPEHDKAREVQRLANEDAHRAFDLEQDLLLRVSLVELSPDEHMVLFNMHHIASDGWSKALLMSEFGEFYEAFRHGKAAPLPPLAIQYKDFSLWQRNWMQGEVLDAHLSFWRNYLADIPSLHKFPLDKPRPTHQTFDGTVHNSMLDEELTRSIRQYCRQHDVTLFMFLHSVFVVLLSRYSGEADIVLGTPVAGRHRQELEDLIGFFVNTLVLRSTLNPQDNFKQLLATNKNNILDVFSHQHLPFEMLVEELKPERSLSYSPVFQMLFVLQNYEKKDVGFSELKSRQVAQDNTTIKFDMELAAVEFEHNIGLTWIYNTALFEPQTLVRLARNFDRLCRAIIEDDSLRLSALELIDDGELETIKGYALGEQNTAPQSGCIHQQITEQASKTPDAVAVVFGDRRLSYAELEARANALAHRLIAQGAKRGQPVGLYLDRSEYMVVAILAVLKAGCGYLPLDPEQPDERVAMMAEDAGIALLLSERSQPPAPWQQELTRLCVDDPALVEGYPASAPQVEVSLSDLAYCIYTSGSTGKPKGVLIEHGALVHRIDWLQATFALGESDAVLQKTPYGFDVSVVEFLWTLATGARLVVAEPGAHRDAERLAELMAEHRISLVQFVPSMLRNFLAELYLAEAGGRRFDALRYTLAAGEAIDKALIAEFYAANVGGELYNLYGPTEATIYASYWNCNAYRNHPVAIGKPLGHTELWVLDANGNPMPVGASGELYIGGEGLARGYHNRDDLNVASFVERSLGGQTKRLYRTGDLVRWLPNGTLEYSGRLDNQVKLRGFRIELGEIEAQLLKLAEVSEGCVIKATTDTGEHLVAYVTANEPEGIVETVKQGLRAVLPEYMVPTFVVALDEMPLNANGKLDRKRLPLPDSALDANRGRYVAPTGETEQRLCELWQQVLKVEQVGIEDNFFELGGHSLLMQRLAKEIEKSFGVQVSVRILFERTNIRDFAAWLNIYVAGAQLCCDDEDEFVEEVI